MPKSAKVLQELTIEQLPSTKRERRPKSTAAKVAARDELILQLWQAGQTREQIAQRTDASTFTVGHSLRRFVNEGQIPREEYRARDGRRAVSVEGAADHEELKQQALRLWNEGKTQSAIAEELGCAPYTINQTLRRLITTGHLDAHEYAARASEHRTRRSLLRGVSKREQLVLDLTRADKTLVDISAALGVTPERARVIRKKLRARLGPDALLQAHSERISLRSVVRELKVPYKWALRQIRAGKLGKVHRRGSGDNASYRLTPAQVAGLKVLRETVDHSGERTSVCVTCDTTFTYTLKQLQRHQPLRNFCSEKCRNQHHRERLGLTPNQRRQRWLREVNVRLETYTPPQEEQWLTLRDATQRAGRSKMQLSWMEYTGILTTKDHPSEKWRGQPAKTYAASQLDIIRAVIEELDAASAHTDQVRRNDETVSTYQ